MPHSQALLVGELAHAVDLLATELFGDDIGRARRALLVVGACSGQVERAVEMTAEVVLAQLRSVLVDLLMLTGMQQLEAWTRCLHHRRGDIRQLVMVAAFVAPTCRDARS